MPNLLETDKSNEQQIENIRLNSNFKGDNIVILILQAIAIIIQWYVIHLFSINKYI